MGTKQISNPGQAFTAGGTWGNPSGDNQMTTEVAHLLNGTGVPLYVGDIVCLDVTGTQAILSTAAGDTTAIGCVGGDTAGSTYPYTYPTSGAIGINTTAGGSQPAFDSPTYTASMTTQSSTTVLCSAALASWIGLQVYATGVPLGATIVSVVAGTSFNISVAATASATVTGTVTMPPQTLGPGWAPTTYVPGSEVPVVVAGFGRINISGATTLIAKGVIAVASASVAGTYVSAPTAVHGTIAVALEAYAARDTTLTTAGITGHDSVRGIIGNA